MIEKIILDHLNSAMSVPVYMERPTELPDAFVILKKTGGGEQNYIYNSMLAVQSYAPTLYQAASLNESIKEHMKRAVDLPEVCRVKLNSDYQFSDPETKQYRYQAVFDITHY